MTAMRNMRDKPFDPRRLPTLCDHGTALAGTWPFVFLLACACVLSPISCLADKVTLRNGQVLEGIIKEESEKKIVIQINRGKMTFPRKLVKSIDRADREETKDLKKKWKRRNFLHPSNVPEGLEDIATSYRDLTAQHGMAAEARADATKLQARQKEIETLISNSMNERLEIATRIEKSDRDSNRKAYNELITRSNAIAARITRLRAEKGICTEDIHSSMSSVSDYLATLVRFRSDFRKRYNEYQDSVRDEDSDYFFSKISESLDSFDHEFTSISVDTVRSRGSAIVEAEINGAHTGRFIVDTGAEIVTISRDFANRLGLAMENDKNVQVVMANGAKVIAVPVELESIRIGDAEAYNVRAVALPSAVRPDVDGLLGMTFLKNFVMRLDGATGRLILSTFSPE